MVKKIVSSLKNTYYSDRGDNSHKFVLQIKSMHRLYDKEISVFFSRT